MNSIIIKRWKEDGLEKVGFIDEDGEFHMLFGLAKDWNPKVLSIIDIEKATIEEYTLKDVLEEIK